MNYDSKESVYIFYLFIDVYYSKFVKKRDKNNWYKTITNQYRNGQKWMMKESKIFCGSQPLGEVNRMQGTNSLLQASTFSHQSK
jgi:hypothetical protein